MKNQRKWLRLGLIGLLMVVMMLGYGGLCSKSGGKSTSTGSSASAALDPGKTFDGQVFQTDGDLMTPLSGADILVNNTWVTRTDSEGKFSAIVSTVDNKHVNVTVKSSSLIQPEVTLNLTEDTTFYFVLQEQSDATVNLTVTGGGKGGQFIGFINAVIPDQTIYDYGNGSVSNKQTSLTMTNAQASKDIRIGLTTYLNPNVPPAVKSEVKGVTGEVIAGADIDVRDSNTQRKISPTEANFSALLTPQCSRIIGALSGEMVNNLYQSSQANLYLWYYAPDTTKPGNDLVWQKAGEAVITTGTTAGAYIVKPKANVYLPNLYPFVFTIESPYLLSIHISGQVKNVQTNEPIKNAGIMAGGRTVLSDEQGAYSIFIPRSSDINQVVLLATAVGFIQKSEIIPVNPDESLEYTKDFLLEPVPPRLEVDIKGRVIGSDTGLGIPNATITLKSIDVLPGRTINNTGISVDYDAAVIYKYEIKRAAIEQWFTVKEGYGQNTLSYSELKTKILGFITDGQTDVTGEYLLKVTATHPDNYQEVLTGSFVVGVNLDIPPSIGSMDQVTIWGGQTTGYFYVTAPVSAGDNKTKVKWSIKLHGYFPYPTNYEMLANNDALSNQEIIYNSQVKLFLLRNFYKLLEKFDSDNDGIPDKTRLTDGATLEITAQATWTLVGPPQTGSNNIVISVQTADPSSVITLQNIVVQDIQSNFTSLTARTESDGSYSFLSLPLRLSGRLKIGAAAANYQPSAYQAIGTFIAEQVITRDITLSPTSIFTIPLPPANLSANSFSSSRINLSWQDKSTNETGFEIQRSLTDTFSSPVTFTVTANTISCSDTSLLADTTYYYRVASYNLVGESAWSSVSSATTPQLPVPPADPSNLTATATSQSQVRLQWTDNSNNETGFRIEWKIGLAGTYTLLTNVSANSTSSLNTGLTGGTTYYYKIRAYNIAGLSNWSNEVFVTLPVAPTAPSNLLINLVSSSTADLQWNNNSNNEDGFRIERKVGVSGNYSTIGNSPVNTYTDTTLADGTVYYYRVWAYNLDGGNSLTATNEASISTTLNAPSALTATGGSSQAILSWTDNSYGETGFRIERSFDGISYTLLNTVPTNTSSYTDSNLLTGNTYYYRVYAYNLVVGNSAYSNVVQVTIPPVAPSNLTASTVSASQINLTWTDNSTNESGFKVERKMAGGAYTEIADRTAHTTSYQDNTGLSDGKQYYYRVFSYNTAGKSSASNEASATTTLNPPDSLAVNPATLAYNRIDLAWSYTSANADGFRIERKTGTDSFIQIATAVATSYSDTNVSGNTNYTYRVQAYNAIALSAWSNECAQTTPPAPPPSGSSTPINGATDVPVSLSLSWGTVNGATSYDVYFGTNNPPTNIINGTNTTGTTYQPGTLSYSTTYYWRIDSKNTAGTTTGSVWSFTTTPPPETITIPNQPTGPTAGLVGTSYSYSTGGSSSSLGHAVEYRFGWGDGTYSNWSSSTTASHSWSSAGNYYVNAQARCATHTDKQSNWSTSLGPVNSGSVPVGPVLVSPANGATVISINPSLTWNQASGATSYDVYLSTSYPPALKTNTTSTSYTPSTLSPNTLYYWRIDAKNSYGTTQGTTWSFTTQVIVPTVTTDAATNITSTSARMNGTLNSTGGATCCNVWFQYGTTSSLGNNTSPASMSCPGSFWSDWSGLSGGITYYYRACASNSAGTAYGNINTLTTSLPTGNISVTVRGIASNPGPWSGSIVKVKRYTTGWSYLGEVTTDSNWVATFSNIPTGQYYFEAYQLGAFGVYEYWGTGLWTVNYNTTTYYTLNRYMPYLSALTVSNNATGADVRGTTVPLGTTLRYQLSSINPGSTTYNVMGKMYVNTSRTYNYSSPNYTTGVGSISPGYQFTYISWTYTPTTAGTYYHAGAVETYIATAGGSSYYATTDSSAFTTGSGGNWVTVAAASPTTIFSETFESAFPGTWVLVTSIPGTNWGDNNSKSCAGSWSGFCADNGNNLAATYPSSLTATMEKRGVSLVGYTSATLTFKHWVKTEATYDKLTVYVRNSAGSWSSALFTRSGDYSSGWYATTIDLSAYAGQSGLYVQFRFDSDGSVVPASPAGVYLDDISLTAQ